MAFGATFDIIDEGPYANQKAEFISSASTGFVVDDGNVDVDGNVSIDDLDLSTYTVSEVTKYQWDFSDGFFFNSEKVIHKFNKPGRYTVSLKIWSEIFQHNGEDFQFVYVTTQFVDVQSRFFKFIIDRFPLWEFIDSDEMEDLIRSAGKFFDRLHSDTSDLYDLVDIHNLKPEFFEYMSQTLGHTSEYASKVGYDLSDNDIEEYDIFDRIKQNKATRDEIDNFRKFLHLSAEFFRNKGTSKNIGDLLSFMGINSNVKDLWTRNWGVVTKGETIESFLRLNDFNENDLNLRWENIRVVSIDNDDGHLILNESGFVIDTYHEVQKIEHDADSVGEAGNGWVEYELNYEAPFIRDITKHDGNDIELFADHSTIVNNDPVRYDSSKPAVLQVDPDVIEVGDVISVSYDVPNESDLDAIVATADNKVKDFDSRVTVRFLQENTKTNLYRSPSNEFFFAFRGVENLETDPYAHFQDFYRFNVNTENSTFSLSKMVYNPEIDDYVTQRISVDFNKDDVYEALILYPEGHEKECEVFEFKRETVYEFWVMVNGSLITAAVRENKKETERQLNATSNTGNDNILEEEDEAFIPLLTAFNFDVPSKSTKTVDRMGNEIYSQGYRVINEEGNWGIGVRNGFMEVREISMNVLDLDKTLFNKTEKELQVKPEYLEFVEEKQLRLNNFRRNKRDFIDTIDNNFDATKTEYELDEREANSIESLFLNEANILEELGTRYVVNFDETWVSDNFENDDELIENIIIPLGSQYGWVVPETRLLDASVYRDFFGNQNAVSGAPGLFSANLSTVLDNYETEPFDKVSALTRTSEFATTFTISDKFSQFMNLSGQTFTYQGAWEEVKPLSTTFETIDPDITLDDTSTYFNEMFLPIVVSNNDGDKVIGVRFRNCQDIRTLISRYGSDVEPEVMLWGSYKFHLPCTSVIHRPDTDHELTESSRFPGHFEIDIFVPLGVLNEEIQDYKIGLEFIKLTEASPSLIEMNGVFCKLNTGLATLSEDTVTVPNKNPFESPEKGLECRYFISASMNMATGLEKPKSNDESKQHNTFPINISTRKFLHTLEDTNKYSFEDDYDWWSPKEVWRKRNFEILEIETDKNILTGINHSPNDEGVGKLWFGREVTPSEDSVKSLRIRLLDGNVTPEVNYYAKVKVFIQYNGFSSDQISNLTERGRQSLRVLGGEKDQYEFKQAPVGRCLEFFLPISWSPTGDTNEIEWGNFIEASWDTNNSISFTPIGLMTQLINDNPRVNINVLNAQEELQRFVTFTPNWTLEDYNRYFLENIEIEYIAEEVPNKYAQLFNKYVILSNEKINVGAFINVNYDQTAEDIDWVVQDTFSYFVTNHVVDNLEFDIPIDFISLEDWVKRVKSVTLNKYVIPNEFYSISGKTLSIETDTILSNVEKGQLKARFIYDLYFDKDSNMSEKIDNFFDKRQISYIPYEADFEEIYQIQQRVPSENLMLGEGEEDRTFKIIDAPNRKAFQSLNKNSVFPFTGRQSGTRTNNRKINIQENEPHARRIYMVNENNFVFDIEAEVYFDPQLNEIKNYRGKKFEIVLNAHETINPVTKKSILDGYYFAGIGSFNFDCGLGISKYNEETNKNQSSFLAGFGDYNTKNIKVGTWYKLRCIVTNDYIRVLFNESEEDERLVMNYFINKEYQANTGRYIDGDFENLSYLTYGLDNLDITYPATVGEATDEKFVRNRFDEQLVKNFRPSGSLCGFRIFNEYTYMSNVRYKFLDEGDVQFGKTFDTTNLTDIMIEINKKYGNS